MIVVKVEYFERGIMEVTVDEDSLTEKHLNVERIAYPYIRLKLEKPKTKWSSLIF